MYQWEDIITQIFVRVDDFCKIFEEEIKKQMIENTKN